MDPWDAQITSNYNGGIDFFLISYFHLTHKLICGDIRETLSGSQALCMPQVDFLDILKCIDFLYLSTRSTNLKNVPDGIFYEIRIYSDAFRTLNGYWTGRNNLMTWNLIGFLITSDQGGFEARKGSRFLGIEINIARLNSFPNRAVITVSAWKPVLAFHRV